MIQDVYIQFEKELVVCVRFCYAVRLKNQNKQTNNSNNVGNHQKIAFHSTSLDISVRALFIVVVDDGVVVTVKMCDMINHVCQTSIEHPVLDSVHCSPLQP